MKSLKRGFELIMMTAVLILLLSDFSLVFAEEFRYDSHGKRDPFLSPGSQIFEGSQLSHGDLRLEGIIVDQKGKSYAIVNSEIVSEGQMFEGFLLKKITSSEVIFEKDKENFKIPLRKDDELMDKYLNQKK